MKKTAYERLLEVIFGTKPTTTTRPPVTTTTTTTTPSPNLDFMNDSFRKTIVAWAKAQVGKPYATYRDCSGFTAAAYRHMGITIPEGSVAQWKVGESVYHLGHVQAGDLLFWDTFGEAPGHVALAINPSQVVHALNPEKGIVVSGVNANMGGPYMGARRILSNDAPDTRKVTKDTDFRNMPRITEEQTCAILAGTPMAAECSAIWRASKGDPLPLAQSWPESNYGKSENATLTHNPLGLLDRPGWSGRTRVTTANGATIRMLVFDKWANAFAEYRYRMDTPDYKGGAYPQGMTLGEYIRTYVAGPGPGYANNESATSVANYLDATVARINRYLELPTTGTTPPPTVPATGYTAHTVPGLGRPLLLPSDIRLRVQLTPMGVTGRQGRKLQPPFQVTRHTTNNPGVGTGAAMHATWQANGCDGNPGIAVHAYVDDKEVVITVPFDEQGVHSGDWRNQASVATELTRNADLNREKAERNAIALDAGILHAFGANVEENLWPHTDGGHCPQLSMSWPEYERRVNVELQKLKGS